MKRKACPPCFILCFIFLGLTASMLDGKYEIFGCFENRFFLLEDPEKSWDNLTEKFSIGDYNRLRLKQTFSPSQKISVNVAVDFYTFHGVLTSPWGTYNGSAADETGREKLKIDLDRAYVDLSFKKFDITIGKQRIALGVSYLWAPLDIFNRVNILEPKEEKPGANAFKIYVPLGPSSALTGVFSPDKDFRTSSVALRAKTQVLNVDTALTLIRSGRSQTTVYGLDLRGENLLGWWFEGGYLESPGSSDIKLAVGCDYTFSLGNGLYWLNEFYYDTTGAKKPADYQYELLLAGERFTLGRTYLLSLLRYSFSQYWGVTCSYIGNLGDGSYILNPMVQYDISQDIQVYSGFYIPLGNRSGEFKNQRQRVFYLWLKINF